MEKIFDHVRNKFPSQNFNSALANVYENGKQSINLHRDVNKGSPEFVVMLCMGAKREMMFQSLCGRVQKTISLTPGSFVVFDKSVNTFFKHTRIQSKIKTGISASLTLRFV